MLMSNDVRCYLALVALLVVSLSWTSALACTASSKYWLLEFPHDGVHDVPHEGVLVIEGASHGVNLDRVEEGTFVFVQDIFGLEVLGDFELLEMNRSHHEEIEIQDRIDFLLVWRPELALDPGSRYVVDVISDSPYYEEPPPARFEIFTRESAFPAVAPPLFDDLELNHIETTAAGLTYCEPPSAQTICIHCEFADVDLYPEVRATLPAQPGNPYVYRRLVPTNGDALPRTTTQWDGQVPLLGSSVLFRWPQPEYCVRLEVHDLVHDTISRSTTRCITDPDYVPPPETPDAGGFGDDVGLHDADELYDEPADHFGGGPIGDPAQDSDHPPESPCGCASARDGSSGAAPMLLMLLALVGMRRVYRPNIKD